MFQPLEIMRYLEKNNVHLDDIERKMKQDKLNEILQNHHYRISQGSDGRWRTYVNDETKKQAAGK